MSHDNMRPKMADEDINKAENFMNNLNTNRLEQANGDIDEILSNLLSSSLAAPPVEDFNDIDDISCEYTELNNTIDALNSYLDVWEERHRNLRAKVQEALEEGEAEDTSPEFIPKDLETSSSANEHDSAPSNKELIQGPEPCNDSTNCDRTATNNTLKS